MKVNPIIVGADGTDNSKAAVRWAAREAQRRGLPLRVTHVYDWEWREARFDSSNVYLDDARRHAEGVTATGVHDALVAAPKLDVEGDPVIGHPAARLLAESEHGVLTVVGSRGHGVVAGTVLGSTGLQLLHHADCPVYVVRPKH
jgi:nucleotide-binding universal stress UspA family protein